jgi:hypothetical protein
MKFELGPVREGLETHDVERLQIHGICLKPHAPTGKEIPPLVVVFVR